MRANRKPSSDAAPHVPNATNQDKGTDAKALSKPPSTDVSSEPQITMNPGAALADFAHEGHDGDTGLSLTKVAEPSSETNGTASVLISGNKSDHQQETLLAEKLRLERELKSKEEKLAMAEEKIKEQNKIIEEYERKLEEKREETETLRRNSDSLLQQIKEAKDLRHKAESQCTALSAEVKALKTEVNELKEKVKALEEKAADKGVVEKRFEDIEAKSESEREHRERRDRSIEDKLSELCELLKTKLPPVSDPSGLDKL